MSRFLDVRWVILCSVLMACLTPCAGVAQTTDRSGIEGKVSDESGGVMPGVTVTVASPALQGGARTTVTDAEGRYRFAALPAGNYQVTFELAGFATIKRDAAARHRVHRDPERADVGRGRSTESVTVTTESPVVDIRTTAVSTNLGKEALESAADVAEHVADDEPGAWASASRAPTSAGRQPGPSRTTRTTARPPAETSRRSTASIRVRMPPGPGSTTTTARSRKSRSRQWATTPRCRSRAPSSWAS